MRIIVDADATPSLKEIALISKINNIECHMFCDYNHILDVEYAKVHYVSEGNQNADISISNFLKENDILITQDYGLAVISLSKKAKAINPNGTIYTNDNIDNLMEQKYLNILNRRKKIKTKNIKKRTKETNDNFLKNLQILINTTKNTGKKEWCYGLFIIWIRKILNW